MKCPSCGFENEEGAKFCQSCGADMSAASATEQPTQAPSPPPPSAEVPPPPPPAQTAPPSAGPKGSDEIDIGGWIGKAFSEVFSSDFVNYLIIGLVVGIVSSVTLMILGGPLLAGTLIVIRRKLRGQGTLDVGAVFNEGFQYFVDTFVLVFGSAIAIGIVTFILQFIPVIGQLVAIVVGVFLGPYWAFGIHFITEEKQSFSEAFKSAWDAFMRNPLMIWVFGLLAGIISGIGSIACGIGVFATAPVGFVMFALMLESMYPPKR